MAIDLTWRNIGALSVLLAGFLVAFFTGTAAMMEWRIMAIQSQLQDRMSLYRYEIEQFEKRLDRLEQRQRP